MKEKETERYTALKREVLVGDKKKILYIINPPVNKTGSRNTPIERCGGCSRRKDK